jgi:hypothetical protein
MEEVDILEEVLSERNKETDPNRFDHQKFVQNNEPSNQESIKKQTEDLNQYEKTDEIYFFEKR